MKSLLVSEVFPPMHGGSGRWMWELYRRLPEGSVVVAAGEHPEAERFDATHDLPITRLPLKLPSWGLMNLASCRQYWRLAGELGRLIRRDRPDRLDCGKCLPEGLLAWMCKHWHGVPYLCFVHGEELSIAAGSRELNWLTRRVFAGAERIVVNSRNTAQLLTVDWNVGSEKILILHPGVDTDRFCPAPRDPKLREQLGWAERPVILTVGRLQKRKGHDMLIRALPSIREQTPDVLYSIVGDGQERGALELLVAELGLENNVQFRGEPSDRGLIECYQQCDLFVLPNRTVDGDFEGFGMVLVEAQACGKPVIAGASGGTAETLDEGRTGWIVDCNTPLALATRIPQILKNQVALDQMVERSRDWVTRRFEWNALAQEFRRGIDPQGREHSQSCAPSVNHPPSSSQPAYVADAPHEVVQP